MDHALETLLDFLKRNRGFDFTGYKRTSLERRLRKRMMQIGCDSYASYLDHLQVRPDEFLQLFNTILINVTDFFRDTDTWDYLKSEIVPRLLADRRPHRPLRIWSAACASGEEAYTLALVLAEALGPEVFREQVKIYATDLDEDALTKARQATYTVKEVQSIPSDLLEKYFEKVLRAR